MITGFNHNLRHRGVLFHVQTEDCGVKNPIVITHVFYGGNVVASRRRPYEKFVDAADREKIVTAMMKEQHKEMMKELIQGRFRGVQEILGSALEAEAVPVPPTPLEEAAPPEGDEPATDSVPLGQRERIPPPQTASRPYRRPETLEAITKALTEKKPTEEGVPTLDTSEYEDKTLDELILEFLDDEKKQKK